MWVPEEHAHALPRGPRPRRQPPGHPGRPGDGAARRRRRRRPRRDAAPAAHAPPSTTRSTQRRRRADRPDRPRRRRHRPRPPRRARAPTRRRPLPSYVALARATLDRAVTDGRVLPIRAAEIREVLDAAEARGRDRAPPRSRGRERDRPRTSRALASELAELLAARRAARPAGRLVPTMGALHEGHASLIRVGPRPGRRRPGRGRRSSSTRCSSAPGEDLDRYPRTLDADLEVCEREGVDIVFAPERRRGLPRRRAPGRAIDAGPAGRRPRGRVRPGHFDGVLTVVAKLFGLVRPDVAVFGEKDYQQLALIRRMVRDLYLGVEIVGARPCASPTAWRCPAATATSTPSSAAATALSRALRAAQQRRVRPGARSTRRAELRSRRRRPRLPRLTDADLGALPDAYRRAPRPGSWSPPGSAPPG